MPFPIVKVQDSYQVEDSRIPTQSNHDWFSLIPLILGPSGLLDKSNEKDRNTLRKLWDESNGTMAISASMSTKDLLELKGRGLLEGEGKNMKLTNRGSKLLTESILNDEKSSFTKQASKKLVAKHSYDFGDKILVRMNNKDVFGTRYVSVPKKTYASKNSYVTNIDSYKLSARKNDGLYKKLSEYTEEELIQVLHLAKHVYDNSHIVLAEKMKNAFLFSGFSKDKIRTFSKEILKELNSR